MAVAVDSMRREISKDPQKIASRYDIIELINAMKHQLPPIKIRNVAKEMGVTEDYVRRRLKKLEKAGLGFRTNFDMRKVGLSTLGIFFRQPILLDSKTRIKGLDENLSYILRWRGNVNLPRPWGIALFYTPFNIDVRENFIKLLTKNGLPEIEEVIEFDITVYDNLDLREDALYNDREKRWKNILNKIMGDIEKTNNVSNQDDIGREQELKHIDLIDIVILAKLQNNSLTSMSEIARTLGISVSKVNRHLQTHLIGQRIIEGNSLKRRTMNLNDPANLIIIIKGKAESVSLLRIVARYISKTWEFISMLYNSRTADYIVLFMIKNEDMEKLDKHLHKIFGEILGKNYFIGILNKNSVASYTIPFISYNRELKEWDLDQQLMDVMKQKFLELLKY